MVRIGQLREEHVDEELLWLGARCCDSSQAFGCGWSGHQIEKRGSFGLGWWRRATSPD